MTTPVVPDLLLSTHKGYPILAPKTIFSRFNLLNDIGDRRIPIVPLPLPELTEEEKANVHVPSTPEPVPDLMEVEVPRPEEVATITANPVPPLALGQVVNVDVPDPDGLTIHQTRVRRTRSGRMSEAETIVNEAQAWLSMERARKRKYAHPASLPL
jgi:hypothetical protein